MDEEIIRELAARWREAAREERESKRALQTAALRAIEAGSPEVTVADWAGIARSTVRRWRGEPS